MIKLPKPFDSYCSDNSGSINFSGKQSTESPIFDATVGQKSGFRARNAGMNEIK